MSQSHDQSEDWEDVYTTSEQEDEEEWETDSEEEQETPQKKTKKMEQVGGVRKGTRNTADHQTGAAQPALSKKNPFLVMDEAADTDETMIAASKNARSTFRFFLRELAWEQRRIVKACPVIAVKVMIHGPGRQRQKVGHRGVAEVGGKALPGEAVDHVWLNSEDFDGKYLTGTLLNKPAFVSGFRKGERLKVGLDDIEDWMFACCYGIFGGFTVAALRAAMPEADRDEHDAAWGLPVPFPEDLTKVPLFYVESSGEDRTTYHFDEAVCFPGQDTSCPAQDAPHVPDHPMAVNMSKGIAQELKKKSGRSMYARWRNDTTGLNLLQEMAIAGAVCIVKLILAHRLISPETKTPEGDLDCIQLARAFNHQHMAQLLTDSSKDGPSEETTVTAPSAAEKKPPAFKFGHSSASAATKFTFKKK